MPDGAVLYESDRGIAVITINRPERRNAINGAVLRGPLGCLASIPGIIPRQAALRGYCIWMFKSLMTGP